MSIPAMLTLCGSVAHVFHAPGGTDPKTGEAYEGGARVQLMAQVPLKNGEAKYDLVTLSTDAPEAFQALKGKPAISKGFFGAGNDSGHFPNGKLPALLFGGGFGGLPPKQTICQLQISWVGESAKRTLDGEYGGVKMARRDYGFSRPAPSSRRGRQTPPHGPVKGDSETPLRRFSVIPPPGGGIRGAERNG